MAIRDLLLLTGAGMEPASKYGLWFSGVCGATLTAATPVIEPSLIAYATAEFPNDLISRAQQDAEAEAHRALHDFSATARHAGITAETLSFKTSPGGVGIAFSRAARCYDAAIVMQSDPTGNDTSGIIEATLFGSGHPLIIIPYIPVRQELGTILVAWDGGETAARAVAGALPVLFLARHVQIVTINRDEQESSHLSSTDLVRHLARHGIDAEARRIWGADTDPASLLLSHAADTDADMIVMGGYGHSRMREFVLGGVTREILRSMTVPVMMAH